MSVKIMSAVWEHSRAKGSELLLLLAIADHADDEGNAFPAVTNLAKKIRMTQRGTQMLLRKLEKSRELSTELECGPNGRNLYRVKTFQGHKRADEPSVTTGDEPSVTTGMNPSSVKPSLEPSLRSIPPVSPKGDTSPHGESSAKITAQELIILWNGHTANTLQPKVQKLTPERQRLIATRVGIHPEYDFWMTVCAKVAASIFLRGEKVDRDGGIFVATFDWLLRPGNALKVYEGNYDDRPIDRAIERHGAKAVKQAIVNKHQEESFLASIQEDADGNHRRTGLLRDTDRNE